MLIFSSILESSLETFLKDAYEENSLLVISSVFLVLVFKVVSKAATCLCHVNVYFLQAV